MWQWGKQHNQTHLPHIATPHTERWGTSEIRDARNGDTSRNNAVRRAASRSRAAILDGPKAPAITSRSSRRN